MKRDTSWKRRMFYEVPQVEDNTDLWLKVIDAAVTIGWLVAFLAIITWAQNRDQVAELEHQAALVKQHEAEAERYSAMLAECMSGGTLFDKTSSTAFFCDRPTEVKL